MVMVMAEAGDIPIPIAGITILQEVNALRVRKAKERVKEEAKAPKVKMVKAKESQSLPKGSTLTRRVTIVA